MAVLNPLCHHLVAASVLITNPSGQALLVSNTYREGLVLPGGIVEPDEAPAAAAEREVLEELGVRVGVTGLLVVQHKPPAVGKSSGLQFVFDTVGIDGQVTLSLQAEEIVDVFWLDPEEAVRLHTPRGQDRLAAAFEARAQRRTFYLDAERELSA